MFTGYVAPDLMIQETVFICNGERYAFTQVGRDVTGVRTPWGPIADGDMGAVQAETRAVMIYPERINLLCAPQEFQVEFEGRATGEEPERPEARIRFWFRDGRLISEADGGRGRVLPMAPQR